MGESAERFESAVDGLSDLTPSERTPYFFVFEGEYASDGGRRPVELRVPDAPGDDGLADAVVAIARDWRKAATHPNIVEVIDWGREPRPWVLTAASPPTLGDRRAALSDGALCSLVTDVTEALRNAGLYNVTHGTLSPSTVRVAETTPPTARADNWGLDAVVGDRQEDGYVTPYTAPERLDDGTAATAAETDVYGAGALAYYALTGSAPFPADREAITGGDPTPPAERRAEIPAAVSDLVMRALSTDPAERPDSPYRFGSRFEQAVGDWAPPPAADPPTEGPAAGAGTRAASADEGETAGTADEGSDAAAGGASASTDGAVTDDTNDTGGGSSRRALLAAMVGGSVVGAGAVGAAVVGDGIPTLPWEGPHPDPATAPNADGGDASGGGAGGGGDEVTTERVDPAVREQVDEYLGGVGNYDGITDGTGRASVTVQVGVESNGGPYGFGPPAVRIDRGATVTWRWVDDTGHNVVSEEEAFGSPVEAETGAEFEWVADRSGVFPYYCAPHEALDMRGALVVTDERAPTPGPTPTPDPSAGGPFDGMATEGYGLARTGHAPGETGPTGGVTERWAVDVSGSVRATPLVVDDTVYVGTESGDVSALSATDGTEEWTASVDGPVTATPTVADGAIYVATEEGTVTALSATDGEHRWEFETAGPVLGSPAVVDGTLYVVDEQGLVLAISLEDRTDEWIRELEHPMLGAPAVANGSLYVGKVDGTVSALATDDGSDRWTTEFEDQAPVLAGTAVRDERVYAGDLNGTVRALAADDGAEQWRFGTDGEIRSTAAVTGETVYAGNFDERVYALSTADGTEQWRFETGSEVFASPAIVDGTVYVGSTSGIVYGLAATDGAERWQFETDGPIEPSPVVVDGRAFVGTESGTVYALGGE